MSKIISQINRLISRERFPYLTKNVVNLNTLNEVKKVFGWENDPLLTDPIIFEYTHFEDVNERRIRDAESLGIVMRNANPHVSLEIGTAEGHSTALMAENAPVHKYILSISRLKRYYLEKVEF